MKKALLLLIMITSSISIIHTMEDSPQVKYNRMLSFLAPTIDWEAIFELLNSSPELINYNYPKIGEPLLWKAAKENNNNAVATLLLAYNANPKSASTSGETALMIACSHKNLPMIELLLEHGANPQQKNIYGRNSFDYAQNDPAVIDMLTQNWLSTSPGSF